MSIVEKLNEYGEGPLTPDPVAAPDPPEGQRYEACWVGDKPFDEAVRGGVVILYSLPDCAGCNHHWDNVIQIKVVSGNLGKNGEQP